MAKLLINEEMSEACLRVILTSIDPSFKLLYQIIKNAQHSQNLLQIVNLPFFKEWVLQAAGQEPNQELIQTLLQSKEPLSAEHLLKLSETYKKLEEKKLIFACAIKDKAFEKIQTVDDPAIKLLEQVAETTTDSELVLELITVAQTNEKFGEEKLLEKVFNTPTMARSLLHKENKVLNTNSTDPIHLTKMLQAMDKLRLKALYFLDKAENKKEEKYISAAKAAFSLYLLLDSLCTSFVEKKITPAHFQKKASQSINHYNAELSTHRGVKQIIYDIANAVFFLAGLIKYATTGRFRLFEAKTDSETILTKIKENIPKSLKPD
ncbi:MAG: hypothetical protein HYX60_02685 [Legionella longbeachae]|nr:hypothetical protein [Legionella longbeachae]